MTASEGKIKRKKIKEIFIKKIGKLKQKNKREDLPFSKEDIKRIFY